MLNINQLSARIQQNITRQLSTNSEQISSQRLLTSDTQKLLKKIYIIKESDKKKRKNKFMINSRDLEFEYITQPKQINISSCIQREYLYEAKKRMSIPVASNPLQGWRLDQENRQPCNLSDLHKLDESIAIDILNRRMQSTDNNFYQQQRKSISSRRVKSQQTKKREVLMFQQTGYQSQTPKAKQKQAEASDFKKNNGELRYILPTSNLGVPIVRTNRSMKKSRPSYQFSMMNDFNYSKLHKSIWVCNN